MAGSTTVVDLLIRARDTASGVIGQVRSGISGLGDAASQALAPLRSFAGLIGAAVGIGGGKEILDRAEAFTALSNQLRIATKSEEEYQATLDAVVVVSKKANSDLDSTARLYAKVQQAAELLGLTQQQVADVTETVAKGMQLSGAATAEASGATRQFTQALASGVLRGDEFNSVMEASPALIKAIADGLGVSVGEMRALAEAGQLTADRITQALLSQKSAIDEVYGKLPQTVGQGLGQLSNAATLFVGKLNEQTGATQSLGSGLKFLAENMDAVAAVMGAAFVASTAKAVQSTTQFVTASLAAREASRQQAIASEQQVVANVAAAQAQVAAAQGAYNRALAEQRATQAQLLAIESLAGLFASEEALAVARAQATAAANAAAAATQRYTAAQAALVAAQGPAAASVGLFGRAVGFLAGPGGLIMAAVSAFALLYSSFSKTKPATDELTASTDQYSEALRKMNQAQLDAASVKLGDAIDEQKAAIAAAADEVDRLKNGHIGLWEALTESKSRSQQLTEAEGAQADAVAKLNDLEEKYEVFLRRSADTQQQAATNSQVLVTAYNQQVTALDKLQTQLGDREKYLKQVSDAEIAQTQALIEKAKAAGDEAKAEQLLIQLAAQRATAAEQQAALARAEAVAEETKVAALEKVRDLQGKLTPQQQQTLALARESVVAKRAEAAASELVADRLKAEAQSQETGIAAKQRAVQITERTVSASSNYVSALESVANAQLSGIRAEIDLANSKGHTQTAQQKSIELAKLEAQWAQTLAAAKQTEIAAEIAGQQAKLAALVAIEKKTQADQLEISAIQLKLVALGKEAEVSKLTQAIAAEKQRQAELGIGAAQKTTEATRANTGAVEANVEAQEKQVKVVDNVRKMAEGLATAVNSARGRMDELSKSAGLFFEMTLQGTLNAQGLTNGFTAAGKAANDFLNATRGGSDALAGFEGNASQAAAAEGRLRQELVFSVNMMDTYATAIELAEARTRKAFFEQSADAERLRLSIQKMADSGRVDMGLLARASEDVRSGFDLLDEEDLSGLSVAIDAVNQKLRKMQQEVEDARARLGDLNAELLEAQGQDKKAELLRQQLDFQERLAEIEKKRQEAEALGNRELIALLDEQRETLEEINRTKVANIEAENAAADATERAARATKGLAENADNLERVHRSMAGIAQTDLSGLSGQFSGIANSADRLREML